MNSKKQVSNTICNGCDNLIDEKLLRLDIHYCFDCLAKDPTSNRMIGEFEDIKQKNEIVKKKNILTCISTILMGCMNSFLLAILLKSGDYVLAIILVALFLMLLKNTVELLYHSGRMREVEYIIGEIISRIED